MVSVTSAPRYVLSKKFFDVDPRSDYSLEYNAEFPKLSEILGSFSEYQLVTL